MKSLIIGIFILFAIILSCTKPQNCWLCTTTYKDLSFNKQYCDYTLDEIKKLEKIELITDTIINKTFDTLYWVISEYDSMPSKLNPDVDTFFLVNWTVYNRIEWDAHPEVHNYWKYGERQGFGVLEVKYDTIIDRYIKSTLCKDWEIY